MRQTIARAAAVSLTFACVAAQANDASFGGSGSDLIPQAETRVRMVSEDIVLDLRPGTPLRWSVTAKYVFENPTATPVTLQMGFPEFACIGGEGCQGEGGKFRDMRTVAGGEVLDARVGTLKTTHEWSSSISRVFLYDVTFPAGERLEVAHSYSYDRSLSVDGEWVNYLTRTGALWSGPIGSARFTVRTPVRPWGASWPPEFVLRSYRETPRRGGSTTEFVFEMKDWTPTRDFVVQMFNEYVALEHHGYACPMTPWAEDPVSFAEELRKLDTDLLRVCRNLPYARHGYRFKKPALASLYYKPARTALCTDGFHPAGCPDEKDPAYAWTWLVFRENPDYAPSLLTRVEQQYIRSIRGEESRRRREKK